MAEGLLVGVAFEAAQAVEVDLAVGAGAFGDDGEGVAQLGFAVEGAGVVGEGVHEFFGDVDDVLAAATLDVAEEGEYAVALGEPAVLGDDLGGRFGRELAVLGPAGAGSG